MFIGFKQYIPFIFILGRIRDVKESNRKCAFLTLAEKVSIRALTIAQRVNLLTVGLKDRSKLVKAACVQMLKAWLRSYNQNMFKLLEAIDIEESVECAELVLGNILKGMKKYLKSLSAF